MSSAPTRAQSPPVACVLLLIGSACGAEVTDPQSESEAKPRPVAGPARDFPPETRPLESLPLAELLPSRPIALPEGVQAMRPLLDPAADGWACELVARRVEQELPRLLSLALGPAAQPELDPALAEALRALLPVPESLRAAELEISAEVVGYELAAERLDCDGRVALIARPGAECRPANARLLEPGDGLRAHVGPYHFARTLRMRWRVQGSDLRLEAVSDAPDQPPVRAAAGAGALFREHTRAVFGADHAFEEQFLRSPEAYFFHSDRLSGYDLIGGHGLALGDLDGDGWEDVYLCMSPGLPNRLFLRTPDGGAREAAAEWGVNYLDMTRSALIVDFDGDGRRDLVLAVGRHALLHWGEAGGLSKPTALTPPSAEDVYGMSAADFDLDGDLDLYVCRYSAGGVMDANPSPYHDARNGAPNHLWRNEGGRKFSDVTAEVGLDEGNSRYSFASVFEDLDDDGDQDLYVANDFGKNHLWRNDGGRFTDVAVEVGAADQAAGMGVAVGDVDGDGDPDLYVSNIYSAIGKRHVSQGARFLRGRPPEALPIYGHHTKGNSLLENLGGGRFADRGPTCGAERGGWAWGAQLFDVENDGDLDIFSPNGFLRRRSAGDVTEPFWRLVVSRAQLGLEQSSEYRDAWYLLRYQSFELGDGWHGEETNVLLLGDGRGAFADASGLSGADQPDDSRSVVPVDWDRDGFLDLIVKNRNAPRVRLLRNQGDDANRRAWLVLELAGAAPNPDAVGARVLVHGERGPVRRSVVAGDGFLAQTPQRLHFGLGSDAPVRAIEVRWPDGVTETHAGPIEVGRAWRIERGAAAPAPIAWEPVVALAAAAPEALAALPGISGRTVLFDKLPLAPLTLPAFGGGQRRVHHFNGRPLLVTLWRSGDEVGEGQLARFAHAAAELSSAGLAVVPLAVDSGAALAEARRTSERLGFREAGFVDGWTLSALEVLLLEVYHRPETNPIPTSLLIDRAGQLCVVYQGPVQVERVLEDVSVLEQMDPRLGTCARLQHGRWFNRPRRDLVTLEKVFAGLGYQDFAGYYAEFIALDR